MSARGKTRPVHCPVHERQGCLPKSLSCEQIHCTVLEEARLLKDRLNVIEYIARQTRECLIDNCREAWEGVSLEAALDTVRLLARSLVYDPDLLVEGEEQVRWCVLRSDPETATPKLAPAPTPVVS